MSFGSEFLAVPDLFPARDSGETWGEHDLALSFAGGPYVFRGLGTSQAELLEERYDELRYELAPDDRVVEIRVFEVAPSDFRDLEPTPGRTYAMNLDFEESVIRVAAPSLMGRLRLPAHGAAGAEPLSASLWTSVEAPLKEVVGVFENFFRLVVAYRLIALGGALLHSAAAVVEGKAYLFLGQSGAGKSTISAINQDAGIEVLSDDMNALVAEEDTVLVEKLPFAGDLGQTGARRGGAPLAGLFRLEKGDKHELLDLSEPEAVALLVSCAPYVNADRFRTDRLMDNIGAMLRGNAIVKRLAFRRDSGFWPLIRNLS